jgi:tripartite-type tricarboxylate transporter receptor subunit TctC
MMSMLTRRSLPALVAGLCAGRAAAQGIRGPVRIVVPFNPGGISDTVARGLAQYMTTPLGRPVVVDNRPGANGSIGSGAVARSAPDGTTLLLGVTDTHAVNPAAMRNLPYDPLRDFTPVSLVTRVPMALAVGPTQRAVPDLRGFIAAARAQREALSYGSWGVGSTAQIAMLRIAAVAGFEALHVPFTGQGPAQQALLAGQVDSLVLPAGGAESFARDGRIRVLAVLSAERLPLMPGVPTLAEQGVAQAITLFQALFAPPRMEPALVALINAAVRTALQAPNMIEVLRNQAAVPEPSTPEALGSLLRDEVEAWGTVIRTANIRLD